MIIIEICIGSSCYVRGAQNVVKFVQNIIKEEHWEEKVTVKGAFCMGLCSSGLGVKVNGEPVIGVSLADLDGKLRHVIQREVS